MRKNKSKQLVLAALAGLMLLAPVQCTRTPETAYAAQVSDPHDSSLSVFDIAPGVLTPAFSPDILEYTSTVDADVTRVSVQAVPHSASSVIASVEGRDNLQPGVNTIKVVCSAQDNTSTAYTITLTVGSASPGAQPEAGTTPDAASDTDSGRDADSGKESRQPADDTGGQKGSSKTASKLMGPVAADGTVSLSGASYKLSSNFTYGSTTQDIPSAFGQGSVQIGGTSYSTLYCGTNGVHLVYMENTDGNGSSGFYYYDEKQNAVERFKYTGIGDNFVVFISSARQELPAGYQETSLTLPSGKEVAASQNLSSDEMQDYYLIYGINSDGTDGWYLYDNSQGTYMRYSSAFASQPEEESDEEETAVRTVSLTKYNSLNEKYTELKDSRVKLVSIFVIVILLLIIAFTAVLLRGQDDEEDDGEQEVREQARAKKKAKKLKKKTAAVSKSSLAAGRDFEGAAGKRAKKVTKNITKEPEKESGQPDVFRDEISSPEQVRAQAARENEQRAYEQKLNEQRAYEKKLSEQRAYEKKLSEQKAYEQKLNEQRAYEKKLSEQRAYEQKLNEQRAYEKKLNEQRAYEKKLSEQRAYEQKLNEQRAYEQRLNEQHAQGQRNSRPGAGPELQEDLQDKSVNLLRKAEPASSSDSVQLAAERMRQSMRFSREIPKARTETAEPELEHDPMDDWDMEETASRKPQKNSKASKKKRRFMEDDMEILDLNDL